MEKGVVKKSKTTTEEGTNHAAVRKKKAENRQKSDATGNKPKNAVYARE